MSYMHKGRYLNKKACDEFSKFLNLKDTIFFKSIKCHFQNYIFTNKAKCKNIYIYFLCIFKCIAWKCLKYAILHANRGSKKVDLCCRGSFTV